MSHREYNASAVQQRVFIVDFVALDRVKSCVQGPFADFAEGEAFFKVLDGGRVECLVGHCGHVMEL